MSRPVDFLRKYHRSLLQAAQVAALCWIGYELHDLTRTVYSGPSPWEPSTPAALADIADKLEKLARAILLK